MRKYKKIKILRDDDGERVTKCRMLTKSDLLKIATLRKNKFSLP